MSTAYVIKFDQLLLGTKSVNLVALLIIQQQNNIKVMLKLYNCMYIWAKCSGSQDV